MKVFQIIMEDEYGNLYHLGFYKKLEDSVPDINDWLKVYEIKIDHLYITDSTLEASFDKEIIIDNTNVVCVRGFIFNLEDFKEVFDESIKFI